MAQDPLAGKTGPNILITGTPGVGKSSFCDILTEELSELNISMKVIDVNQIIKNNKLYEEEDAQRKCLIVDEEKVCVFVVIVYLVACNSKDKKGKLKQNCITNKANNLILAQKKPNKTK